MTKKDYIFNMSNLIKNRAIYHAPVSYNGDVDFEKIMAKGVDLSLPVFIMEKPLKKLIIKSFIKAQKEVDFNLILREKNKKIMKKIKRCFVIKREEIPSLDKLNINYKTCSKYNKVEQGNYIKLGEVIKDFEEKLFYLEKKDLFDEVYFIVKKYLLNGENIQIEVTNTSNKTKIFEIEYNHDLERGYYNFQKIKNGLKITNLFNNKEIFFNASFGRLEERYSCIDGVENSTFARINFKANVMLKPFEKRVFFLNLGNKNFNLANISEMNYYFELSQKKNFEIFDTKIISENKFFERNFNKILPVKIWRAWLEGKRDMESENQYSKIKNNIILNNKKKPIFQNNSYKISEIFLYNGNEYKKIAKSQ